MKIKFPWSILVVLFTLASWGYLIGVIVSEAVR